MSLFARVNWYVVGLIVASIPSATYYNMISYWNGRSYWNIFNSNIFNIYLIFLIWVIQINHQQTITFFLR